jgi:predicted transcriptional regulator
VTLDDDLFARLKRIANEREIPFKVALNEAVREGLAPRPNERHPFRTEAVDMGRPRVDLTKALQLAAELEDEEIARKLELGK